MAAITEAVKNQQEQPLSQEERLQKELDKAKQLIGDQVIVIQAFKS